MATPFLSALDLTNREKYQQAEIDSIRNAIIVSQTQQRIAEQNRERQERAREEAITTLPQLTAPPTPDQGPQSPPPGQPSSPMAPSPPGGGGLPPPVGQPTPMASAVTQMPQPSGWRPSPVAPPSLGGQTPPPQGAAGLAPPPQQQPVVPPQSDWAADTIKLLTKKGLPPQQIYDTLEAMAPLRDQHNKEVMNTYLIEMKAAQAGEYAARAEKERLQAEMAGKPKPEAPTMVEKEARRMQELEDQGKTNTTEYKALKGHLARIDRIPGPAGGGGEGKAPSAYRWSKTEPGRLEAIPGGPADPQVVASKKNAIQLTGGRESVYTTRVMQAANQASKDLANIVKVPVMTTGIFGGRHQGPSLIDATKEVLAQKMTSQEAQTYNVMATGLQRTLASVETSGLAQGIQEFSKQIDVVAKEGDTELTKLHKLAQVRQIIEAGLEPVLANPRVAESEKDLVRKAIENVHSAVPFTHSDLIELTARQEANSNTTLRDVLPKFKGGKPGASKYVETRTTADGRTLGKKADGTIEEVK